MLRTLFATIMLLVIFSMPAATQQTEPTLTLEQKNEILQLLYEIRDLQNELRDAVEQMDQQRMKLITQGNAEIDKLNTALKDKLDAVKVDGFKLDKKLNYIKDAKEPAAPAQTGGAK